MGIKQTSSNDPVGDITKAQIINLLKKKQNIIKTTVANETEMLALTGLVIYDIVKRADLNNALFQLIALPASNIANWIELGRSLTPAEEILLNGAIQSTEKGANNGVAPLDGSAKVPLINLPNNLKEIKIVATITDRNNIIVGDRFEGLSVLVEDATGDPTVTTGYATYILKAGLLNTDWLKTGEGESIDLILSAINTSYDNTTSLLTATTVQGAIDELQTEKEDKANKNQPNGYIGSDSDNSVLATQLEKPVLNFLPRVFYSFEIAGGVATFDNTTNTINKNNLLLCTASDGSLTFNKGTLYQIDTTTATPTTAMLSSYLTPSQMVGKTLTLHRDFNNYPKSTYTANDTETDLISYTDLKVDKINITAESNIGSASKTPTITINTQGQITVLTEQDIAIASNQVAQATITPTSGNYADGDTQEQINNKGQGQINEAVARIVTVENRPVGNSGEGKRYFISTPLTAGIYSATEIFTQNPTTITETFTNTYQTVFEAETEALNITAIPSGGWNTDISFTHTHDKDFTAKISFYNNATLLGEIESLILAGNEKIVLSKTFPTFAFTSGNKLKFKLEVKSTHNGDISVFTNDGTKDLHIHTPVLIDVVNSAVQNALNSKADQSTTYTKIETDTALDLKQNNIIRVSTQADMLALAGVEIDKSVVYVIADKIQYQLTATPSSNISSWTAIASNTSATTNKKKYYASPTGTSTNSGNTEQETVDLATVFNKAGNTGNQVVLLPGTYTGNITNTNLNQTVTSGENETGGIANLNLTFQNQNISSSNRYNGISFATFNHTSAGGCYLENSRVNTALNLTGTGFFQANNCDTQGGSFAGQISITSAINAQFIGSKSTVGFLTINNAGAVVTISDSKSIAPITLTSGVLNLNDVYSSSAGNGLNAVNATGGTFFAKNTRFSNPLGSLAKINIGAGVIYDLTGCEYDKIHSTIHANAIPYNEISYFTDWISSKHNVTNIIETTDNKPTVAGIYVFNGQPANGFPTGITVADLGTIFVFNGTTWTKHLFFADAPISIFNSTNNKSYTKNSTNNWLQVGSGGGGFSVTADTTTTTLDLNNLTTTGITNFSGVTSLINGPTGIVPIAGKLLTVEDYVSTNGRVQNLLLNDNKSFRSYINSIWSSWQLIATVDTTPNSDIIDGLATPPASPSNGNAYIMLANPTGVWSTFAQGTVTTYNESTDSWVNTIPANGSAITFSNPVNLNSINSYYIAGQTYKYNSGWGSPVITGLLWQLYVASSQFQPYDSQAISLALASNVVTATCPQNHNLAVGYSITISSSPNAAFNETVTVTAIVSPTVFRYAKTLANTTTTGTLKATTQLLPSGCTSALIPSTISFNVIIAVAAGSYSNSSSFICTNLRSAPCYVAGIPIGKLESIVLIPNATAQWQSADKKYTIENIPTGHGFTNALYQNKVIVMTGNGDTVWTLADSGDLARVIDGKFVLNVIDANNILVANYGLVTTFIPHNLLPTVAYSYGNGGNLVDGTTITTGYKASNTLIQYRNDYQFDWYPDKNFHPVIASLPVALQVEAYNKQFAVIDGVMLNGVNNILTLPTTTSLKINSSLQAVSVKFSGQTKKPLSGVDQTFTASQIPVFGVGGNANPSNPNPDLLTTIKHINSYGNGGSSVNFILAINSSGKLFAIPNSNFVGGVRDITTLISGQIGFQLNPLKAVRHNGTAVETYDFVLMGQVTSNALAMSNLINVAFNRIYYSPVTAVTLNSTYQFFHNIGADYTVKSAWLSSSSDMSNAIEIYWNADSDGARANGIGKTKISNNQLNLKTESVSLTTAFNTVWAPNITSGFIQLVIEGNY